MADDGSTQLHQRRRRWRPWGWPTRLGALGAATTRPAAQIRAAAQPFSAASKSATQCNTRSLYLLCVVGLGSVFCFCFLVGSGSARLQSEREWDADPQHWSVCVLVCVVHQSCSCFVSIGNYIYRYRYTFFLLQFSAGLLCVEGQFFFLFATYYYAHV
jgi:hypothetical protein